MTCLECGKKFKVRTKKHMALHNMTIEEYKEKWGIPKGVALVCKNLQNARREKMKSMQLWKRKTKKVNPE